jgi:hypothetical protein
MQCHSTRVSCDQRKIAMPVSLVPLSETHITGRQREAISPSSDPSPGQRGVGDERQAFPREVIDDRQDAETSAVGESIRQEVQAPALIGTCGSAIGALVPSARLRPPRRRTCSRSSR